MNPLIRWWATPYLPEKHIYIDRGKVPEKATNKIQLYFKKWFVHPIKRRLAKFYLTLLRVTTHPKVIAITGSSGKTTVKDMLTSILKNCGRVVSTYKNIDPIYNIPDTILKTSPLTRYLILEMGVEFPGEMNFYLWLAKPDVGIITNIYPTHTEFFKNTNGVFKEKSKLLSALDAKDIAVVNYENSYLRKMIKGLKARQILFGKGTDVFADKIRINKHYRTNFRLNLRGEKINVVLPVAGEQFVENALSASAVAFSLGVNIKSIKRGLEGYITPEHRMRFIHLGSGATVLDDSYNNNPEAAKRTISTFNKIAKNKKRLIVFGDMLELGAKEKAFHKSLGNYISKTGVDYLIGVGKLSRLTVEEAQKGMDRNKTFWRENYDGVAGIVRKIMTKDMFILIKGSRGIGLDKVVSELS